MFYILDYFFSLLFNTNIEKTFFLSLLRSYLSFFFLLLSETSSATPFLYHKNSREMFFKINESNIACRYIFVKIQHPNFLEVLHHLSLSFVLFSFFFLWLCCMCVCLAAPFFFLWVVNSSSTPERKLRILNGTLSQLLVELVFCTVL